MSTEAKTSLWSRPYLPYVIVGGAALLIAVGVIVALVAVRPSSTRPTNVIGVTRVEEPLEIMRLALSRSTDVEAGRQAVQQMNDHLRRLSGPQPPELTPTEEQRRFVELQFKPDEKELGEVS